MAKQQVDQLNRLERVLRDRGDLVYFNQPGAGLGDILDAIITLLNEMRSKMAGGGFAATAEIGSGVNGVVTLEAPAEGESGNAYTVETVLGTTGGSLAAAMDSPTALLITLGTDAGAFARYDLAVGTAVVRAVADAIGVAFNANTLRVILGTSGGALAAGISSGAVTVTLGMDAGAAAYYDLAVGTAVVRAILDAVGVAGNSDDLAVVLGVGADIALSANFTGGHIVVTLGTTPTVAAYEDLVVGTATVRTTMDVAGVAGNANDLEVVVGVGLDVALSADFTATHIVVTLGTDGAGDPDVTKNTATLIRGVIHALSGVSAAVIGSGTQTRSTAFPPDPFLHGSDGAVADVTKNTATLIAGVIDGLTGVGGSVFSGSGAQTRSTVLSAAPLLHGADIAPDAAKNTATLIAAEIDGLSGVGGSVLSGSGAQVRSTVLSAQNFTGGLALAPDDTKNEAVDVAAAVNALDGGIGAVASGDGSGTIGGVVGPVSFAGGSDGISAPAVPELE